MKYQTAPPHKRPAAQVALERPLPHVDLFVFFHAVPPCKRLVAEIASIRLLPGVLPFMFGDVTLFAAGVGAKVAPVLALPDSITHRCSPSLSITQPHCEGHLALGVGTAFYA